LTSFPVFVAGIHQCHHGPRSRRAVSVCRHGRSVRDDTEAPHHRGRFSETP
jgi:hypothetical protein